MKKDELTKTLSKTEKEIDELYKKLEKAQNTKNFILKQLGQFEEGVRKNDQVIGKYYYCPKNKALYHPQIYGTEFSTFNWDNNIIYRGNLIMPSYGSPNGNVYYFYTQMAIDKNFLNESCEKISKTEFIKKTKELMEHIIIELEKTDAYDNEDLRQ